LSRENKNVMKMVDERDKSISSFREICKIFVTERYLNVRV